MKKSSINLIWGQVIHDSRGDETIQVSVKTDSDVVGTAAIPAGLSTGSYEVKPVEPSRAVEIIKEEINPALVGKDCLKQKELDKLMIELDNTSDKSRLGANSILGVSMAISRAAAATMEMPLYRYIAHLDSRSDYSIPIPMMNLINGGKHAENNLDIQEFMIVPDKIKEYHNQLSAGKLIFSTLGQFLKGDSVFLPTGDEGGYAPSLDTNEMALDYLVQAIKQSNYRPWEEVSLALDIAANNLPSTFEASNDHYLNLIKNFPIISIEDPFDEENWQAWSDFYRQLEQTNITDKKILLVGDDLFVTNPSRLEKGIKEKSCNAILVKLNQIGTVTETIEVVELARRAGFMVIISHRSGETLDDFIADFAVGINAQFIKTGAPNDLHPERMSKYRRLLMIEQELRNNNGSSQT